MISHPRALRGLAVLMACIICAGCAMPQRRSQAVGPRPLVTPAPRTLSILVEPDQGIEPVYHVIAAARRSIDVTMYELADPLAEQALTQAAARGVAVRVILDKKREQEANRAAFDELSSHGVHVVWASQHYAATHQKTIVIDHSVAAIMSLNLTSRYYGNTRDFAVLDIQHDDVDAIEKVFDADFRHAAVHPPTGADLVWSPGSESVLLGLIGSATSDLLVQNEEMALPAVTDALMAAARRGVRVTLVMTRQDDWADAFDRLVRSGVEVRVYAPTGALYIHAKSIVVDAGTPQAQAFVGSENFSDASLQHNRELGVVTADPAVVATLAGTIRSDASHAVAWKS